jgi:TrpR-related protein YerC/YecD
MSRKLKDSDIAYLYRAILSLQDEQECDRFFEDLCTISEIKSLAQRLAVARMLHQHKTYSDICDETGVSTATISRVNRCLEYGADGYKLVLERLETDDLTKGT